MKKKKKTSQFRSFDYIYTYCLFHGKDGICVLAWSVKHALHIQLLQLNVIRKKKEKKENKTQKKKNGPDGF